MKINRRGFLSLGLGASAGLTLTPLPWKLLDDISIWTQNWPWVPVPKDGRVSFVNSVCTLCSGGCAITARKIDERVVSISAQGRESGHQQGLCPLGLSGPQLLYTPSRVMSPGLRTDNGFQAISWKQAVDTLFSKLKWIRELKKPERLACLAGSSQGSESMLLKRFLSSFGSSRFFHTPSADDSWEAVTKKLTGRSFVPGYDLEGADTLFSFGCGLVEGWGSPVRTMGAVSRLKDRGAVLVQVEPRLTNTAAAADSWVAVKPGSEADLALGMCRIIVDRYPGHRRRLAGSMFDWQAFLSQQADMPQVASATGLTPAVIQDLADRFAGSKRPLALCGRGEGASPISSREILGVVLLNILSGNINRPGGMQLVTRNSRELGELNSTGPSLNTPENLVRDILKSDGSPVDLLLVSGSNPCYEMKDSTGVYQAIDKIPFTVCFASHWDETARNADLVLPVHSHLERYQDLPLYNGLASPRLGLSQPVSRRLFESRYVGDVLIEAASLLGGPLAADFPWFNYEHFLQQTLDKSWSVLKNQGFVALSQDSTNELPALDPESRHQFESGPADDDPGYPLMLIPKASMRLNSGTAGSPPFMVKAVDKTVLQKNLSVIDLNPETAAELMLSEGDRAQLRTSEGSAEVIVHLDEGTMPGLVVLASGLGHTAYDEYLADKVTNINQLLGEVNDPMTGHNITWGARAKLIRV